MRGSGLHHHARLLGLQVGIAEPDEVAGVVDLVLQEPVGDVEILEVRLLVELSPVGVQHGAQRRHGFVDEAQLGAARAPPPLLATMALAGFGIGAVFAINPAQIHRGVPPDETGSANSFYQVLRYVGYSVGSALSATFLVINTSENTNQPTENGYTAAAWTGIAALVLAAVAAMRRLMGVISASVS